MSQKKHPIQSLISRLLLCGFLLVVSGSTSANATFKEDQWLNKVDPWVIETSTSGFTEFIVMLKEQAELSGAASFRTKAEKGAYVFHKLTEVANRTQPAVIDTLNRLSEDSQGKISYRSYWVINAIWVRGDANAINVLAKRADVAKLYANPSVHLEDPISLQLSAQPADPQAIEWNISKINAPLVWEEGYTGQGIVIGGQDTGYDWDHPALINQYRGWDGTSEVHDYHWHDAIHENDPHTPSGNPCGFDSPVPCDDSNHGTHTMGIMVGDDGNGHQIGVAPGARWIGCRNMEQEWGTPDTYTECYQWFIAPTDLNGENPRPDLAPDVINNSWRCPFEEGCTEPDILKTVVEAVRAAGILTVHAAGNNGPTCSSVNTPAAIYDASFSVGNTDRNDVIYMNSSRGPVNVDGSNRLKPDISAPGTNIVSSVPSDGSENNYYSLTGTSMAAPHVAGAAALLLSARPNFIGQVDAIETRLQDTAIPRTTSEICGEIPGSQVPNNTYGWGRVDAWNAINVSDLIFSKIASNNLYDPGQIITYTLQVTLSHSTTPLHNLVISDTLPSETSFITATVPHQLNDSTVVWEESILNPDSSLSFDLVVQISPSASGAIINEQYAVSSSEITKIIGVPFAIYKAIYYYLPWFPVEIP